jgi:hypothetical protein
MFRKMAIALVAASVFTAPVLAQNPPLSGGGTTSPSNETQEKANKPEKTEKSVESVEKTEKTKKTAKAVTKHHRMARHHRHGTKAAKYGKARSTAMSVKHPGVKTTKYVKVESRHTKHGRIPSKHVYGKASKHMRSGTPAR